MRHILSRIILLSSAPGQKTGTANYIDLLIEQISSGLETEECLLVCDLSKGVPSKKNFGPFKVVDYKYFASRDTDRVICFLANNDYHAFVVDFLYRVKGNCDVTTVIHDPQMFMLIASMCRNGYFNFSIDHFKDFVKYETIPSSVVLCDRLVAQSIPEIVKYTLSCQSVAIAKSNRIVVHSRYAKLKLVLEHANVPRAVPIIVAEHPRRDVRYDLGRSEKFRIGCFGWISSSKRPKQVLKAFADFIATLEYSQRAKVSLTFVGELTSKELCPNALARSLRVDKYVSHTGYLPSEQFMDEMRSCRIIVNLRFPSCGETSGTFNQALASGQTVILSDYQAFSEESASYHISIDPDDEVAAITDIFAREFRDWLANSPPKSKTPQQFPKIEISTVLREILG